MPGLEAAQLHVPTVAFGLQGCYEIFRLVPDHTLLGDEVTHWQRVPCGKDEECHGVMEEASRVGNCLRGAFARTPSAEPLWCSPSTGVLYRWLGAGPCPADDHPPLRALSPGRTAVGGASEGSGASSGAAGIDMGIALLGEVARCHLYQFALGLSTADTGPKKAVSLWSLVSTRMQTAVKDSMYKLSHPRWWIGVSAERQVVFSAAVTERVASYLESISKPRKAMTGKVDSGFWKH